MTDILFEITKENLETGLRGYPVGYCVTSYVDPEKGLHYLRKPITELANWEPERVIYLLYYGKEGTREEIEEFKQELRKRAECRRAIRDHIRQFPREGQPIELFAMAILLASLFESTNDYQEDCLNIIAKIPEIAAIVINHHAGWGGTSQSKPELGYVENFTQMLNIPNTDLNELNKVLKLFTVLHYDHGGGNLSTFVGKAVASGLENMYGSLAASMCALAGPRHGRANQDCLEFLQELLEYLGENATENEMEEALRKKLEKGDLIFGFGHAVLRVEDPRAIIFYDYVDKKYQKNPLVKIAKLLRKVGPKVLKENPKITDPYPNMDAISGTFLSAAGFSYPEYFTVLFGMARVVGIAIQIVYERCFARGGKGTPIVRPKYLFKDRDY